ncbi:MAG: hypothetical protein WAS05_00245 [Candidatus Nanopelagicales bacterium]
MSTTKKQSTNLDEWIDSAERTTRAVPIYGKAGLVADLDQIEHQLKICVESERAGLQEQWDKIAAEIQDSKQIFKVQGCTKAEFEAVRTESVLNGDSVELQTAKTMALSILEPKITADQLLKLQDKVGEGQIAPLMLAIAEASRQAIKVDDLLPS